MKEFKLIEHHLVPLALVVVNLAVPHLVYLLIWKPDYLALFPVIISLLVLAVGIFRKYKYLMIGGTAVYLLALVLALW